MQTAQEAYQRLLREKLKLGRQDNPFAGLKQATAQQSLSLTDGNGTSTTHTRPGPPTDEDLLEQARVPLVEDIEGEIEFLKDVKVRLARSMKEQSRERVDRIIKACVNKLRYHLRDKKVEVLPEKEGDKSQFVRKYDEDHITDICDMVNTVVDGHLCKEQLSIEEAKALRDASAAIAKMVEQYRKFLAGMTIKLEFNDDRYNRFMRVFFKVIPPEYQVAFAKELEKYAPESGKTQKLNL